jgi:tRNA pseudouridine38-40 synthase
VGADHPPGRTLKLTVCYDGTDLVGWQRQAEGDSVQAVLEDALARFEGAPVVVHGAGRTDAGVHALGQVASVTVTFEHDNGTLARALNAQLPPAVRVVRVDDAKPGFHARFDARAKTYRYLIRNAAFVSPFERAFVWHVPQPLDREAMHAAARLFEGTHDFAAFRSLGSDSSGSIRTIHASGVRQPAPVAAADRLHLAVEDGTNLLSYEVRGDGFLRHMVRTIAGTLVEVGRGWREPASIAELLRSGRREQAGATAPPQGLFLVGVDYD